MKILFLFYLERFFCSQDIWTFVLTFWSYQKTATSQLDYRTISTNILPNISRNKVNQALKYGQSIEYNTRNIFLEKSYIKCGGETISGPLSKKKKKNKIQLISGSVVLSFIQFVFLVYHVNGHRNILKLSCRTLAFTSHKAFLKKQRSGASLPFLFSAWFLKKNICYILLPD